VILIMITLGGLPAGGYFFDFIHFQKRTGCAFQGAIYCGWLFLNKLRTNRRAFYLSLPKISK
jgi:hypothetical protein